MSNTLLKVQPSELKIPYEARRQNSCRMQLSNKTDHYVAFKVKTTNPRKYSVRPTSGVVLPRSSCSVLVTMQAPREILADYHCKDKFLVQSTVVKDRITVKDIVPAMFNKVPGRVVEEVKLRVVYIPANPPSPVPEEDEEVNSPRSLVADDEEVPSTQLFEASPYEEISGEETFEGEVFPKVKKLREEKMRAIDEQLKLKQQLEVLKKQRKKHRRVSAFMFLLVVFISAVLIGYLVKANWWTSSVTVLEE